MLSLGGGGGGGGSFPQKPPTPPRIEPWKQALEFNTIIINLKVGFPKNRTIIGEEKTQLTSAAWIRTAMCKLHGP